MNLIEQGKCDIEFIHLKYKVLVMYKNPIMNPLILQYTEKSNADNFDFSKIEYNSKLNLTVDRKTGLPAIDYLNMSTETFTKTHNESSDCDSENLGLMMGTLTHTSYELESSDDDSSF